MFSNPDEPRLDGNGFTVHPPVSGDASGAGDAVALGQPLRLTATDPAIAQDSAAGERTASRSSLRTWSWIALALVIVGVTGLALWLRLRVAQSVDMSVDEFTSLWAARRTAEIGVPRMLSGAYYVRGLLLSYHIAALAQLTDVTRMVARLPAIFYGVAVIPLIAAVGWREWNARVGFVAALGMALVSDAIVASARVRFYSLAMFFALLAVWAHHESLRDEVAQRRSRTWIAVLGTSLAFGGALLSYEGAALLYPVLVITALWWRGWRWFLRPPVITAQVICLAMIGLRFGLETAGAHSYLLSMQEGKAILAPMVETPTRLAALLGAYSMPHRLIWGMGSLIASAVAVVELVRRRGKLSQISSDSRSAVVYLIPVAAFVSAQLLLVGDDYGVERQLLIVEPFWVLVGASGLLWVVDWLTSRSARKSILRWAAALALGVAICVLYWPEALRAANNNVLGYEPALRWLSSQIEPGDVTLSPQPPACAVELPEPCTYYMRSVDYEAYMVDRADGPVDLWSGAPLISTTDQLSHVIQNAPRTWIVIDEERLGRRHPTDFIEMVTREFKPVYSSNDVWVLLADGWRAPREYAQTRAVTPPLDLGPLHLVGLARGEPERGSGLPVRLTWRVDPDVQQQVNTSLQLVAGDGTHVTQSDGPPAAGLISTMSGPTVPLPDAKTLMLPEDLPDGRYRLDVTTYEPLTGRFVAGPAAVDWFHLGPEPPVLPQLDVAWDSGIRLVGAELPGETLSAGSPYTVTLAWSADEPVTADYVFFVQLLDADGALVAQADREPEAGFYPTSAWKVGESVQDSYTLDIPATLPQGDYSLITGMYRRDSLERARLSSGGDAWVLSNAVLP